MGKLTLYDWRCKVCNLKFEEYMKPSVNERPCIHCGNPAKRLISAPRLALPGTDPDFPRAYEKWEKTRRNKQAEDKKFFDNHGTDKKHHSFGS